MYILYLRIVTLIPLQISVSVYLLRPAKCVYSKWDDIWEAWSVNTNYVALSLIGERNKKIATIPKQKANLNLIILEEMWNSWLSTFSMPRKLQNKRILLNISCQVINFITTGLILALIISAAPIGTKQYKFISL